jgi:hypothetical protein
MPTHGRCAGLPSRHVLALVGENLVMAVAVAATRWRHWSRLPGSHSQVCWSPAQRGARLEIGRAHEPYPRLALGRGSERQIRGLPCTDE